jgi:hypothetical protein
VRKETFGLPDPCLLAIFDAAPMPASRTNTEELFKAFKPARRLALLVFLPAIRLT